MLSNGVSIAKYIYIESYFNVIDFCTSNVLVNMMRRGHNVVLSTQNVFCQHISYRIYVICVV